MNYSSDCKFAFYHLHKIHLLAISNTNRRTRLVRAARRCAPLTFSGPPGTSVTYGECRDQLCAVVFKIIVGFVTSMGPTRGLNKQSVPGRANQVASSYNWHTTQHYTVQQPLKASQLICYDISGDVCIYNMCALGFLSRKFTCTDLSPAVNMFRSQITCHKSCVYLHGC